MILITDIIQNETIIGGLNENIIDKFLGWGLIIYII